MKDVPTRRITSPANAAIRDLLRAVRKGGDPRTVLLEGPHLVQTAAQTERHCPVAVYVEPSWLDRSEVAAWLSALAAGGCTVFEVSEAVIRRLSSSPHPQGLVGVVSVTPASLDDIPFADAPLLVVADAIQDPGNVGTLIRTADAAGADAVVLLEGSADPWSAKALRASAGSVFHLPVVRSAVEPFLARRSAEGLRLAGVEGAAPASVFEADLSGSLALVFGNEGAGLSTALRRASDMRLAVPMRGRAESLNVGAAAAVCIYEAVRRRGGTDPGRFR